MGSDSEFYYQTVRPAFKREGDVMKVLDVLAKDVGVRGSLLRLGGDGDVLRQLHGTEVSPPDLGAAACRASVRSSGETFP